MTRVQQAQTGELRERCEAVDSDMHTVDGRNPASVDMVNIPFFTGFHTSQVVQDFFHQQYFACFSILLDGFRNLAIITWNVYDHTKPP